MVKRDIEEADIVALAVAKVVFAPRPKVPCKDIAQEVWSDKNLPNLALINLGVKVTSVDNV